MVKLATPTVYLVSQTQVDTKQIQAFLSNEGVDHIVPDPLDVSAPEFACEVAGRLCYMSYGKGRKTNKEFLQNILASGHGSVLEHAVYGFIISGVSRSFTHELVRHRHLSFSQLSQRYVDESESPFIIPKAITSDSDMEGIVQRSISGASTAYSVLVSYLETKFQIIQDKTLRRKMARQAARCVLPNATETKIYVTGNARAWRHFIEVRGSSHADPEIRQIAIMILKELQRVSPNIFGDYEISGGEPMFVTGMYKKV